MGDNHATPATDTVTVVIGRGIIRAFREETSFGTGPGEPDAARRAWAAVESGRPTRGGMAVTLDRDAVEAFIYRLSVYADCVGDTTDLVDGLGGSYTRHGRQARVAIAALGATRNPTQT